MAGTRERNNLQIYLCSNEACKYAIYMSFYICVFSSFDFVFFSLINIVFRYFSFTKSAGVLCSYCFSGLPYHIILANLLLLSLCKSSFFAFCNILLEFYPPPLLFSLNKHGIYVCRHWQISIHALIIVIAISVLNTVTNSV